MGGKAKQSQRTKNNARPASSARSAEILGNVDATVFNVGGKALPALFPTLARADLDHNLNPEFTLCMKKLNKKDPITKTKALQELCELVNKSDVDHVVAALPAWAHHYRILATDNDHKVREMAQVTHGAVVGSCGRRCAPQLRALIPAWLHAQHDEYAPAAHAAMRSLHATFPANKLPEVMSFCRTEVMSHIQRNLLGSSDSVVTTKTENPEEKDLQYCRIVSSSLQGLQYLCERLPAPHDAWLWQELGPLLRENSFWNLGSHTSTQLRASWFGCVAAVVSRFGAQFGEHFGQRATRLLLAAARDRTPQVANRLWGCLLALMHHVQDWDRWLDKKELLSKRILDMLENGGWGDARPLCDMLLPLLAHLPADMLTKLFYEAFFNSIFSGLEKKSVISSKSERRSWIMSLSECLQYVSIQQDDFVVEVATAGHRSWLERVFLPQYEGQVRADLIKCSATNMATLVKYWIKLSTDEKQEKYDQLVRNFWQNIGATLVMQVDKLSLDQNEINLLLNGQLLLLQSLKSAMTQNEKRQTGIRFSDDPEPVVAPAAIAVVVPLWEPVVLHRFEHNLNELVDKICSRYFEFSYQKQVSGSVLSPLTILLREFDHESVWEACARLLGVTGALGLYDCVLRRWLTSDTMRCRPVADLVFLILKHLTDDEQDAVFDSFKQFTPPVVEWCIGLCLSAEHACRPATLRWMQSALVVDTLESACGRALREGDDRAADLVCAALDTEVQISEEAVRRVVQLVCAALEPSSPCVGRGAEFACRLPPADGLHQRALLAGLLGFLLDVKADDERLEEATWGAARDSCVRGLAALSDAHRTTLRMETLQLVHQRLFAQKDNVNIENLEHIMAVCPYLIVQFSASDIPDDFAETISFSERLLDLKQPDGPVEVFALRHDCITAKLNCPFDDDNDTIKSVVAHSSDSEVNELCREDLVVYATHLLFRTMYLRTLFCNKVEDGEYSETRDSWYETLLGENFFRKEFNKNFHDYAVINSLHEIYAFWPYYEMIQKTKLRMDQLLDDIVKGFSEDVRCKMLKCLSEKAASEGYYWSYAAKVFESRWGAGEQNGSGGGGDNLRDSTDLKQLLTGNGYFHSVQAHAASSSDEELVLRSFHVVMTRSFVAAHGAGDPELCSAATTCAATCSPDAILDAYYRRNHTMLYERELHTCRWAEVVSSAAVAEFLAQLVTCRGWELPPYHWDFAALALCSLLTSVRISRNHWGSTKVSMMCRSVLRLYAAVFRFVHGVPAECERRTPAPHIANLPTEWRDIFAPDIHHSIFDLLLHLLDSSVYSPMNSTRSVVIGALMEVAPLLEWELAPREPRSAELSLPRVTASCARALADGCHHHYKYLAFVALDVIAKPLVLDDAEKLSAWSSLSSEESEQSSPPPEYSLAYLEPTLFRLEEAADGSLQHVQVGEQSCEVDAASPVLGYLLLAHAVLSTARLPRDDLAAQYNIIFRERKYLSRLVGVALRVMPPPVSAVALGRLPVPPPAAQRLFHSAPNFTVYEACSTGMVGALACRSLLLCVRGAGDAARGWRGAGGAPARALDRLLHAYISPHLIKEQLTHLYQNQDQLPDTKVHVHWSTDEAECVVNVEDRPLRVTVSCAREHPLSPPRVSPAPPPAPSTHWIALYITYQNGSLLNALKLWVSAVSRRVERAPQCYICYCRLHPGSGRLPTVHCHQCRNKFHTQCLSKWFTTSAKSNCPLCRAAF